MRSKRYRQPRPLKGSKCRNQLGRWTYVRQCNEVLLSIRQLSAQLLSQCLLLLLQRSSRKVPSSPILSPLLLHLLNCHKFVFLSHFRKVLVVVVKQSAIQTFTSSHGLAVAFPTRTTNGNTLLGSRKVRILCLRRQGGKLGVSV